MNCRVCNAPLKKVNKKYAAFAQSLGLGDAANLCDAHLVEQVYTQEPNFRQLLNTNNLTHLLPKRKP